MKINEIFYSVQGEGFHAGTPAVFIRFSGCNLNCPFCDTKHKDGYIMSEDEIVEEVNRYTCNLVVITGGEPSLFLTYSLVQKLKNIGFIVCVETNGTRTLPENVDFVTCSPKFEYCKDADVVLEVIDELKVVYNGENDMSKYDDLYFAKHLYLQPCDTGNAEKNKEIMQKTVRYCLEHPEWKVSLQTQKILDVR